MTSASARPLHTTPPQPRVAALAARYALADLNIDTLRSLAQSEGYDAALSLLYHAVRAAPPHAAFIAQVESLVPENLPALASFNIPLAIVPGALYKEHPETGADGRRFIDIVRAMGLKTHTIPVKSLGTLAENARIITGWLAARSEPFLLVSFSKGSADVKTALQEKNAHPAFRHVSTWLSVGGILQGTPLVNWLKRQWLRLLLVRFLCLARRLNFGAIEELAHGPRYPLANPTLLPEWLTVIHLISFPTQTDLSLPLAHRAFKRILPLGPNDAGGLLLGDLPRFPGLIFPLHGADHYLRTCGNLPDLLQRILLAACLPHARPLPTIPKAVLESKLTALRESL